MRAAIAVLALSVWFDGCSAPVGEPVAAATAELEYCPGPATLEGIDVSEWQGGIDWGAVAASGKAFAIARVSDGLRGVDPTFDGNYAGIAAAGMVRGSYQFFRPLQDPIAQADLVLAHIGALGVGDLPPMLDVESTPGDPLPPPDAFNAAIHAWIDRIQGATGRMPLIYAGSYFWEEHVGSLDFGAYPLVMPAYGPVCPRIMAPWDHWIMHQYSSTGRVPGIGGDVDLDVFDGDASALRLLAGAELCHPHCEGSIIVDRACGRGDCAAYGSSCVEDGLGARCVFFACPPTGEVDACVDDSHITHCIDGAASPPGDCGAYGALCSSAGSSTARCVSVFCVANRDEPPSEHPSCLPDGQLLHCHADATIDAEHCPSGETCVIDPMRGAGCGAPVPDAGAGDRGVRAGDAGVVASPSERDGRVTGGCSVAPEARPSGVGALAPLFAAAVVALDRRRRRRARSRHHV